MRRMSFAAALAAGLALALAAGAEAHEGHSHAAKLMGTVKAVHADTSKVEITTTAGKPAEFYVGPATKYLQGTAAASLADLKAGTRLVVETKVEGGKTVATLVKLGGAAAAPAAKK
jgi:Cu/Ag efflux protein CusF